MEIESIREDAIAMKIWLEEAEAEKDALREEYSAYKAR